MKDVIKNVSVVVPAYNEQDRLYNSIQHIHEYLSKNDFDFEIIVDNDGSKDATQEVINELKKNFSNIRSVSYSQNCGKGHATKQGMLNAEKQLSQVFLNY